MTADARFCRFEDVLLVSAYLRNVRDFRLIGLFTEIETFEEFESEGYFEVVKAGDNSNGGKSIGFEILESEMIGDGQFLFDSYLINSLNELLDDNINFIVDPETGLIKNTYEETRYFADVIQGMGEPVVWTPFELYEYDL